MQAIPDPDIPIRQAVLRGVDWFTAAEVGRLARLSERNITALPHKWKRVGRIFVIAPQGIDYYPGYGLNPKAGYRPYKAIGQVIQIFAGHKDGWGLAHWFQTDHPLLGGQRPQDVLAVAPQDVINAALHDSNPK